MIAAMLMAQAIVSSVGQTGGITAGNVALVGCSPDGSCTVGPVPNCTKGQTINPGESCRVFFNGVPYISTVSPGMGKPITVGQGPGWGDSKGSVIPAARAGEPIWFVTAWNPKASFYQPRAWFLSHAACEAAAAIWKGPRPYGQKHLRPAVCGGMGYGVPALLDAQP